MRARYTGETSFLELTRDKAYEVISIEDGWYRAAVDLLDDDYLYPPELFEVIEPNDGSVPVISPSGCEG